MNTNYAGFWKRFLAWLLDKIILGTINWIILVPILAAIGITSSGFPFSDLLNNPDEVDIAALVGIITAMAGVAMVIQTVVNVLYHSFFESSKFQGSIGKMALSIIVTDSNGAKLDFTKALVRNLCCSRLHEKETIFPRHYCRHIGGEQVVEDILHVEVWDV
jgi:uncharacterized RDD family membrane protein YckC